MAEPMGEKPVMALAGIGEVLGKRLEDKGFDKVTWFLISFCSVFIHTNFKLFYLVGIDYIE